MNSAINAFGLQIHLLKKMSLLVAILATLFIACVKTPSENSNSRDQALISESRAFFNNNILLLSNTPNPNNYRACQPKMINWDLANVLHISTGDAVVVPITYRNHLFITSSSSPTVAYNLNSLTLLVIIRDVQNEFQANLITFIPDSLSRAGNLSGLVLTEDWQGNSLSIPYRLGSLKKSSSKQQANGQKQIDLVQSIQVCNEIDGYNYSADDPSNGESWSETSCSTYELQNTPPGGPLAPVNLAAILAPPPIPLTIIQSAPKTPIANIADYFKCFTPGDLDHNFSVTIAVEQPVPGTRQPWTFTTGGASGSSQAGNIVNVGHTFLIFSEGYGGQPSTQRSVGFYPQGLVTPFSRSALGVLGDDEYTDYDICLTISVSSSQFFAMLQYVTQGNNTGYIYDLNSNNCTTFALDALDAGGVSIPSTIGFWIGNGQGLNPGDLGEDIRNMMLPNSMSRNTVSNSHPNIGTCN